MAATRSLLCRLTLAASLLLAACGAATATPALFRVSDPDSHIWLFGSIHYLDANRDWRTPEFDAALAESEFVYFEMLPNNASFDKLVQLTTSYGYNRDGIKLTDHLTEEQRVIFDEVLTAAGVDPRSFDPMRPWAAEAYIGQLAMSEGFGTGNSGTALAQGVEMTIADEISDDRERAFEAVETQFRLISGGTDAEHIASLMAMLASDDPDAVPFDPRGLIDTWVSGDLDGIHALVSEAMPTDGPVYRRMLTDRNRRWAVQMAAMLAANESAIAIVGAGHLAGPTGLPALLAEHGLTVERVAATPSAPARSRSQSR